MSIKSIAEARIKSRAECRAVADELLKIVIERLDKAPTHLQVPAINMLQTELQILLRKEDIDSKHSGGE